MPTMPVTLAGWRMEPPVSVPVAPSAKPAATAAAEPPEEPPGTKSALLLRALEGVPRGLRTGRFRAVVALALPGGQTIVREGTLEGWITEAPRGASGFGYDPVFELPDGRTVAELGAEKQEISHRAQAVRAMISVLQELEQENPRDRPHSTDLPHASG